MNKKLLMFSLFFIAVLTYARGSEIGYVERFSLAADRKAALGELIPGTKAYFYYNTLHALNEKKIDQARVFLLQWKKNIKSQKSGLCLTGGYMYCSMKKIRHKPLRKLVKS